MRHERCWRWNPLSGFSGYRATIADAAALDTATRGCPRVRGWHGWKAVAWLMGETASNKLAGHGTVPIGARGRAPAVP